MTKFRTLAMASLLGCLLGGPASSGGRNETEEAKSALYVLRKIELSEQMSSAMQEENARNPTQRSQETSLSCPKDPVKMAKNLSAEFQAKRKMQSTVPWAWLLNERNTLIQCLERIVAEFEKGEKKHLEHASPEAVQHIEQSN